MILEFQKLGINHGGVAKKNCTSTIITDDAVAKIINKFDLTHEHESLSLQQ